MGDWQPIETAPKDEEVWILGCREGTKIPAPCAWDAAEEEWFPLNNCFKNWKPTHWQPLPAPPAPQDAP